MSNEIKNRRLALGYTQERLAFVTGLSLSTVYAADHGGPDAVSVETLAKIARALDTTPEALGVRTFLGLPVRRNTAVEKALGAGPPSAAEAQRRVDDLQKAAADLKSAREIVAADGHMARVAKAVANQDARSGLSAAERKARELVATAKELAGRRAAELAGALSPLRRREIVTEVTTAARVARQACLEVVGLALAAASTAGDAAEATGLYAKASSWIDEAAGLRVETGAAD